MTVAADDRGGYCGGGVDGYWVAAVVVVVGVATVAAVTKALGLSESRRTAVGSGRGKPRSRATGNRRAAGPSGNTGRTGPEIRTLDRTWPPNRRTRCKPPNCRNRH